MDSNVWSLIVAYAYIGLCLLIGFLFCAGVAIIKGKIFVKYLEIIGLKNKGKSLF